MTDTISLESVSRLARAIHGKYVSLSDNKNDVAAFKAVYALTADKDVAAAVCDSIVTEYILKRYKVPHLPPTRPTTLIIEGEAYEKPIKRYFHGEYVWVDDQQTWYMAVGTANGFQWNEQKPGYYNNLSWYRTQAIQEVDEVLRDD